MPSCLIISNGLINDYSFYKDKISAYDYIICADGGINHAIKSNAVPNLWLGDFDSCKFNDLLTQNPWLKSVETITLNPQKDVTDTHYACIEAIKRGYNQITVWGGCGGRIDHMLSNIHILEFLLKNGVSAKLEDEKNTIHICDNTLSLCKARKYLSLIPMDTSVKISALTGVKYPLKNYTLTREISMGVSNEITSDKAELFVKSGLVLVIESDD